MSHVFVLAGVALANMLGIISPSPAFLLVDPCRRRTLAGGWVGDGFRRRRGRVSLGGCRDVRRGALLARFAAIYAAIQIAGGIYLIWLGLAAWRHGDAAAKLPEATPPASIGRALLTGFVLTLGNPIIIVFFANIFVALFPVGTPHWIRIAAVGIVALQETLWYALVALLFSRPRVQAIYGRLRSTIEHIMGAVFVGLGARLVVLARL